MLEKVKQHPLWREAHKNFVISALAVSVGAIGFGYDNGWWGATMGLKPFARRYGAFNPKTGTWALPAKLQSAGSGMGSAGIILGIFASSPLNERFGRKKSLLVLSFISLVGIIMEATALTSIWQFLIGRLIVFGACGIAANVVPMYQSETAPESVRGALIALYQVFMDIGKVLAAGTVYGVQDRDDDWGYRIVVLVQLFIPFGIWLFYPILVESPRWLLLKGRREDATKSLAYLRTGVPDFDVEYEIKLMEAQINEEVELRAASTYRDCFRGTNLRRTIIAIGIQTLQQCVGVSWIINYLILFVKSIGFNQPNLFNVIFNIVATVVCISSFFFTDRFGRRPLLLICGFGMGMCFFSVGAICAHGIDIPKPQQAACVFLFILWEIFFSLSWGPCVWITTGEVGTQQLREKTISLSTFGSFGTSLPIGFINPYVQDPAYAGLEGRVAFIYASLTMVAITCVYFYLPELKGRSLEELDEMFGAKVATRKFKTYKCHRVEEIERELVVEKVEREIEHIEDHAKNLD